MAEPRGGAREGLIGQAAQVLFAGVVRQLEDLGVHGPEHELAYVEVVAQVDAVLRVDARLRARPGLELSSLGLIKGTVVHRGLEAHRGAVQTDAVLLLKQFDPASSSYGARV